MKVRSALKSVPESLRHLKTSPLTAAPRTIWEECGVDLLTMGCTLKGCWVPRGLRSRLKCTQSEKQKDAGSWEYQRGIKKGKK